MADRKPSFYGRRKTGAFAKAGMRGSVFQQPVLKEGYLEKQSSGMVKKWQSRYFELSGHYLKYYEKKEGKSDETLKGAVDLQEISEVTSQSANVIIVMNDGKKLNLKSPSDQVAGLWVTEIQQVAADLKAANDGAPEGAANPYAKGNYDSTKPVDTNAPASSPQVTRSDHAASVDKRVSAVMRARRQQRANVYSEKIEAPANFQKKKIPKTDAQKAAFLTSLNANFLFKDLSDNMKHECIDALEPKEVAVGTAVITQGDDGDYFYVVETGDYDIIVSSVKYDTLTSGVFGELALLYNCPRAATVECSKAGTLWQLDRQTFRATLAASADSDVQLAKKALHAAPLLSGLDDAQVTKIAEVVQAVKFTSGDKIITLGAVGNTFYIIKEGTVECKDAKGASFKLKAGEFFGERAILTDEPRAADVFATSDVECLALDRDAFNDSLGSLTEVLDSNVSKKALESVPILKNLSDKERSNLAIKCNSREYPEGASIIKEGEAGQTFYIIKSGKVKVSHKVSGSEETMAELEAGAFFGEMALLNDEKRQATVTAGENCECLMLDRAAFDECLGPLKDIMEREAGRRASDMSSRKQTAEANKAKEVKIEGSISLDDITLLSVLGQGTFGKVKLVQHKETKMTYALKILQKAHVKKYKQQTNVMAEKEVMVQARHPFILQLVSTMKDDQKLYMLLEICLGGELFTYLHCSGRPTEYVEDHHARFYAACVLDAFEYLHDKMIVYRDLKPENLMLDSVGYIKVVDFGFAKVVKTRTYTLCGTPEYLAPELVTGRGHNKGVDYWAFGVLIYEMVTGYSPFAGPETPEQSVIVRNILRGKCSYPSTIKNPQCKSIVQALLVKEQSRRLGCLKGGSRDIKNHKWFTGLDWDVLRAKTEPAPFQPPIKDSLDTSNFDPWEEPDDEEFYYDDGTNWDAAF